MARRVVIGKLSDNSYRMRVSKAGYDAGDPNTSPNNLIFDSNWPSLLPIFLIGSGGVGRQDSNGIQHNLNYVPLFTLLSATSGSSSTNNANVQAHPFDTGGDYTADWVRDTEYYKINTTTGSGSSDGSFPFFTAAINKTGISFLYYAGDTSIGQGNQPYSVSYTYCIYRVGI